MGNFYTNITVRDGDAEAVAATLGSARRRAYVVRSKGMSVVFDERCDMQDLRELEKLARQLSKRHGPSLAVCNHDDDVLWYALALKGKTVDRYDSLPSFSGEGGDEPAGGDAAALCAAFGKPGAVDAVTALLRRPHTDYTFELERHEELCRLLDLPAESAGLGYRYVERGELEERGSPRPIATGGALEPAAGDARATSAAAPIDAEGAAAVRVAVIAQQFRLLRSEIDVPPEFSDILGTGRVNAMLALGRLRDYIRAHKLPDLMRPDVVRADASVQAILGRDEAAWEDLPALFAERLGVPPLTADEEAAIARDDPDFTRRYRKLWMDVVEVQKAEARSARSNRSPGPGDARFDPAGAMARAKAAARSIYPLVRSEIDVPPECAPVLGAGRVNAMRAFLRLQAYILKHELVATKPPCVVRGDALVQAILGQDAVEADQLPELFCRRFAVPPWTEEEDTALENGDMRFLNRLLQLQDEVEQERGST
ncbi:MAG TPA: hypothetical protein VF737_00305 [Gemmatimonadaceae bacterium]